MASALTEPYLCATFGKKKLSGSGQVTELWRHRRYSLRPMFQVNRVFSRVTCCYWLEWRYYAWFRETDDYIRPLVLHLDLSKVIRGHWPCLTTCWFDVFLGFVELLRPNTRLIFHIDMFIVPLNTIWCQSGPLTKSALWASKGAIKDNHFRWPSKGQETMSKVRFGHLLTHINHSIMSPF